MMRRIVATGDKLIGDEDHAAAFELVTAALRAKPDEDVDLSLLVEAAQTATRVPYRLAGKRKAVFDYVLALGEPQREIFRHRIAGRNAREIAAMTKTDHKEVCKSLSLIYGDLNVIVTRA